MIENPKEELHYCISELDKQLAAIQVQIGYQRNAIGIGKLYRLSELQLREAQIQKLIGWIQILKEIVEGDRNDQ